MLFSSPRNSLGLIFGFFSFGLESLLGAGQVWSHSALELQSGSKLTRLILKIPERENIVLQYKSHSKGFRYNIKGLGLTDLGAPLEQKAQTKWLESLRAPLEDARLQKIELKAKAEGLILEGTWRFPQGQQALAYPKMESLSYRGADRSMVLDFWWRPGPRLDRTLASQAEAREKARVKVQQEPKNPENVRISGVKTSPLDDDPFSAHALCHQALDEEKDVFLAFYPVHERIDFAKWFPANTADESFPYYKPKKKTKESLSVHVALRLYGQGKAGLVIKTLEQFQKEFPRSDFQHEMKFLKANALIKLGLHRAGERLLKDIMLDARDSPVALFSAMYLTQRLMKHKDSLPALQNFLWMIRFYPDHSLNWVFHLGAAECLYELRQTERALKEYEWVTQNATDENYKAQGLLRRGDLYLHRFNYEQALSSYTQVLAKLGNKTPAAVYLNQGETLYSLGQHDEAQKVFEKFIELFGAYPAGWRATFRLGEIFGRKSISEADQASSRAWFYKTVNSYPYAKGATLARMRLAPCGDHAGFQLRSFLEFFERDADPFDGEDEVSMKHYDEFRVLSHIRSIVSLGTDEETLKAIIQDLPSISQPQIRLHLAKNANHLFRKQILSLLDAGKNYEALSLYQVRESLIPGQHPPLYPDYLLRLARSASDLGLIQYADKLLESYQKKKTYLIGEEKNILNSRQLRIESSNVNDLLAIKAWSKLKSFEKPEEEEDLINELEGYLQKIDADSPWNDRKTILQGLLAQLQGDREQALLKFSESYVLRPSPRILKMIASLQTELGDLEASLQSYQKLSYVDGKAAQDDELFLGLEDSPSKNGSWFQEAAILERQQNYVLLEKYYATWVKSLSSGDKQNDDHLRVLVEWARVLVRLNKKSQAIKILEDLEEIKVKTAKGEFWKSLGAQTLANLKIL